MKSKEILLSEPIFRVIKALSEGRSYSAEISDRLGLRSSVPIIKSLQKLVLLKVIPQPKKLKDRNKTIYVYSPSFLCHYLAKRLNFNESQEGTLFVLMSDIILSNFSNLYEILVNLQSKLLFKPDENLFYRNMYLKFIILFNKLKKNETAYIFKKLLEIRI